MGLFIKEIRDYKILERYRKSLDAFYEFGETEKYRLLMDKKLKQYILRQDKENPKKVVYLGWLRGKYCVFHDKIFYINTISYTGNAENPLNYIDVETGNAGKMSVLSNKGFWLAMHWHCQDVVNEFGIKEDALVLEVTRYKESSHNEKEFTYTAYVTYNNGQFHVDYVFPDLPARKRNNSEKAVEGTEEKPSSIHQETPSVKKPGLIYGDDIVLQVKSEE